MKNQFKTNSEKSILVRFFTELRKRGLPHKKEK